MMAQDVPIDEDLGQWEDSANPIASGLIGQKSGIISVVSKKLPELEGFKLTNELYIDTVESLFHGYNPDGLKAGFVFKGKKYLGFLGIKQEGDGFTLQLMVEYDTHHIFEDTMPVSVLHEIPQACVDLFGRFVRS